MAIPVWCIGLAIWDSFELSAVDDPPACLSITHGTSASLPKQDWSRSYVLSPEGPLPFSS